MTEELTRKPISGYPMLFLGIVLVAGAIAVTVVAARNDEPILLVPAAICVARLRRSSLTP